MKRKNINKTKENSLSEILNPLLNYLIQIDNQIISETESFLAYTLGVPKNWIMETDIIYTTILTETPNLKVIKLEKSPDSDLSIDDFYSYIINLIEKNLLIDQKRLELENEINRLKNQFSIEQEELINELYNTDDEKDHVEHNGEETIN
jgi:hypothetical protein